MEGLIFREDLNTAVRIAVQRGLHYDDILKEVSTVLGMLIRSGSADQKFRLQRARNSMLVVKEMVDKTERE